jgi:hypothetical protein
MFIIYVTTLNISRHNTATQLMQAFCRLVARQSWVRPSTLYHYIRADGSLKTAGQRALAVDLRRLIYARGTFG